MADLITKGLASGNLVTGGMSQPAAPPPPQTYHAPGKLKRGQGKQDTLKRGQGGGDA